MKKGGRLCMRERGRLIIRRGGRLGMRQEEVGDDAEKEAGN